MRKTTATAKRILNMLLAAVLLAAVFASSPAYAGAASSKKQKDRNEMTRQELIDSLIPLPIDDISVTTETDYRHADSDKVILGNDEGVTIQVRTTKSGITADDICLYYDEEKLNAEPINSYKSGKQTVIQFYVTANKAGNFKVEVCTLYDILTLGEDDVSCYTVNIRKLGKANGEIVYITPTGEKYHTSTTCAGENYVVTTYYDAQICGYAPCRKCA